MVLVVFESMIFSARFARLVSLQFIRIHVQIGSQLLKERRHPGWWKAVQESAKAGSNPRETLNDLLTATKKLSRQKQGTIGVVSGAVNPGKLEKELAFLIFLLRGKISFNVLNDPIAVEPMYRTFRVKLRKANTIKNLTFALHEVGIRQAVEHIRAAGAYSITVDYWTAINGNHFLSITYHWTDEDWNVRCQTLDLVPVKGTHTGTVTKEVVEIRTEAHFSQQERWGEDLEASD